MPSNQTNWFGIKWPEKGCYAIKTQPNQPNHVTVCKQINTKIELFELESNTWNHLTVCKLMNNIE